MINASNKFGTFEYKKNKGENAIKKKKKDKKHKGKSGRI